jgi:hypothetical protein
MPHIQYGPPMSPNAANAILPTARQNLNVGNFANVLDYGADPTGVNDSSTAINDAAGVTTNGVAVNVYLPAGRYYVKNQITIGSGQTLYGDGRGNTTITVDQGFSSTASAVISLTGREQLSPTVRDLDIDFTQPSSFAPAAPTLGSVAGGSLGATTYYVKITYTNSSGETNPSSESSLAVGTDDLLTVASPAATTAATAYNVYVATTSGSETLQNESPIAIGTSWTEPSSGLVAGVSPPISARSYFLTLAGGGTSGAGGSGIQYPPAILITSSNRFRLQGLRIARAWTGISNASGNGIGGFFISNIEMSALNIGMLLNQSFDFGHIAHFHYWDFDISGSSDLAKIYYDGDNYAAQFGTTGTVGGQSGEVDGIAIEDFCIWSAQVSIQNTNSWLHFTNLMLDGGNACLDVVGCQWLQISNVYATSTPSGNNTNTAQINVGGGTVVITNIRSPSSAPMINQTGGNLFVDGGLLSPQTTATSAITQSGGNLSVSGVYFASNTGAGAWTVPVIDNTAGTIQFQNNFFNTAPGGGNVGGLVIANDNVINIVSGNNWNGWKFSPPTYSSASPGIYWPNSSPNSVSNLVLGIDSMNSSSNTMTSSTALGFKVMPNATSASNSTGVGGGALASLTTGVQNTAVGQNALTTVGSATNNVAVGASTLANCTGGGNTGVGQGALGGVESANSNTGFGISAGGKITTGTNNLVLGPDVATTTLTTGSNNVLIGTGSSIDTASSSTSNYIGIGAGSTAVISATGCGTPSTSILTAAGSLIVDSATGGITVGASGPTLTSGSGAPSATQPVGSLYLNTSGSTGSRLYVSAGSGTWNAVAGV